MSEVFEINLWPKPLSEVEKKAAELRADLLRNAADQRNQAQIGDELIAEVILTGSASITKEDPSGQPVTVEFKSLLTNMGIPAETLLGTANSVALVTAILNETAAEFVERGVQVTEKVAVVAELQEVARAYARRGPVVNRVVHSITTDQQKLANVYRRLEARYDVGQANKMYLVGQPPAFSPIEGTGAEKVVEKLTEKALTLQHRIAQKPRAIQENEELASDTLKKTMQRANESDIPEVIATAMIVSGLVQGGGDEQDVLGMKQLTASEKLLIELGKRISFSKLT